MVHCLSLQQVQCGEVIQCFLEEVVCMGFSKTLILRVETGRIRKKTGKTRVVGKGALRDGGYSR